MKIISKATLGGFFATALRGRFGPALRFSPHASLAAFGLLAGALQATVPSRRPLPADWGIMVYDDSDFEIRQQYTPTLAAAENFVAQKFQAIPSGTPRWTYARSVAFGSDNFYFYNSAYDTYVSAEDPAHPTVNNKHYLGWRPLGSIPQSVLHADSDECGVRSLASLYLNPGRRLYGEMGFDPLMKAAKTLKPDGEDPSSRPRFVLNWRVNDQHYKAEGPLSPSAGEFRANSYAKGAGVVDGNNVTTGDDHPYLIDEKGVWDWYYDYSNPIVQENRLQLFNEFVDRYAAKLDGVELDFQRNNIVVPFSPLVRTGQAGYTTNVGHGASGDTYAAQVTVYLRKIRQKLNAVSEAQGRPIYLIVRVPSTIRDCRYQGMLVDEWINETSYVDGGVTHYHGDNGESLVDIVVPTLLYDNSQNLHLKEFLDLAHPAGQPKRALVYTTLHGNMFDYTGARAFTATPPASYTDREILSYAAEKPAGTPHPDRDRFIEFQRAGILSYKTKVYDWVNGAVGTEGVDGFEILNYQMYNPFVPGREKWLSDLITELGASETDLRSRNRVYSITAYRERSGKDWNSGYPIAYGGGPNQLPVPSTLRDYPEPVSPATYNVAQYADPSAHTEVFKIYIPETIPTSGTTPPPPVYIGLRIALNPSQTPPDPTTKKAIWNTAINLSETINVRINSVALHTGALNGGGGRSGYTNVLSADVAPLVTPYPAPADDGPPFVVAVADTQGPLEDPGVPDKTHYLQMQVDPANLVNGLNTIEIDFAAASTIQVTEISLGILHN